LGAIALPGEAHASGISVARFGGEHGHPTTTNATAIFYNPAGIGMSDGFHIFVDGTFAWRTVSYQHDLAPTDDGSVPGANDGKGKLFNILASPMIGITGKLGDVGLGAGFYTPYGGQSIWDKNDKFKDDPNFAGPYDGVQRWYVEEGIILRGSRSASPAT
jgi:long-chain fatty acid transport protein